ncbi:RNA exonuclease 4 [Cucurbitaria berberidis CBS 394.84]|uniref:RNA exonuclease 4 n=1 Tax=Cucurbitaria berberidis CBS 394.84 TaxID=1168544 RepID=A0A9P4L4F6_9PLEO|nr:RNA exonuclease 4 [Cucurbitaria berberidis CBS 394.84]KAF1841264.1 RNA exonuclease 4 [Cucurbitaria berberidis CBS 394.84]
MAPIDLDSLSSNWKNLQAKLKPSTPAASPKVKKVEDEDQNSFKRKRSQHINGKATHISPKSVNGAGSSTPRKLPGSRKRQKMEEPASVGASIKQHDTKSLSRGVSMPSLKQNPLLGSSKDADQAVSVIAAHPDFPDIENEGVSEVALPGKYVALDCEMVGVGPEPNRDSALARVSLVNFHGHQVYDSYVQIPRKIEVTDYRTAVSGIEPKHLRKDVARPFDEVRNDLKILLGGRILVGHAVKNDLDVLILKHDKHFIRDTSKFSKFRALAMTPGRTPGLKLLAEKLLGVEIQVGAHSSVEDARATMALYRLDKGDFEKEIRQKYGHVRLEAVKPEVALAEGEELVKKTRNRKKKKKRN